MVFKRIPEVLKSGAETDASRFVAPDPANELKHPENQSLFARFKEDSRAAAPGKNPPWAIGYGARAHSDLIAILYGLISDSEIRNGSAYGRPVMANRQGLVFAYAQGTHSIFLKLRGDMYAAARQDGGRYDPTYGKDWIEFRVGGRVEGSADWRESMERWARMSYRDTLSIE
jgi:hypothetical protein